MFGRGVKEYTHLRESSPTSEQVLKKKMMLEIETGEAEKRERERNFQLSFANFPLPH